MVPAAWTSSNGTAWARAGSVELPEGTESGEMTSVTSGPDGLVASGVVNLTHGVVWRSADGAAWEIIGAGDLFDLGSCPAGCPTLTSIASGPAGIVVTGYRVQGEGLPLRSDLWFSRDGTTWTRALLPVAPGSSLRPTAESWVASTPQGFTVAGTTCKPDGLWPGCRAVTWTSPDGMRWSDPVALPEGSSSGAKGIQTGADRLMVIGQTCGDTCRARVWATDSDGRWALGDLRGIGEVGAGEGTLTVAGATFLVFGTRVGQPSLWSSDDGLAWSQDTLPATAFPSEPGFMLEDAAGSDSRVLMVGVYGESERPAVWASP